MKHKIQLFISVFSACIGSFQYGYHLAELNAPKNAIQCQSWSQLDCIAMNQFYFSLATSMFTVGGFVGTIISGLLGSGRRSQMLVSSLIILIGCVLMISTNIYWIFVIGRFLVGLGSGIAIFNAPIYISEISPLELQGILGTLTQLAVNLGIFATAFLGYLIHNWRLILAAPIFVCIIQCISLYHCPESPKYLYMKSKSNRLKSWKGLEILRPKGYNISQEIESWKQHFTQNSKFSFSSFIDDKIYRRLLLGVCIAHASMQFSGINIVFIYSVPILQNLFYQNATLVSLLITIFNIFTTFISTFLIDKIGRKSLLLLSLGWVTISQLGLMISLICGSSASSFVFFLSIVMGFSLGLCVIPFIIIPELFDSKTADYANKIANPVNWGSNFIISFGFLPLLDLFHYYIFLVFVGFGCFSGILIFKHIPETKGLLASEVQQKLREDIK
eukprot:NODE_162_length_14959_cov_1.379610.p2 type:complete len:445 gc:universal NODE_162_length_14959_cov_1.379610:10989-9655(-)